MGKYTKKIIKAQSANSPEDKPAEESRTLSKKEKRQQFWLLTFILFSAMILIVNHDMMDKVMTSMYGLLIISLTSTFLKGLKRFNPQVEKYLVNVSVASMVMAMILFAYTIYDQFVS